MSKLQKNINYACIGKTGGAYLYQVYLDDKKLLGCFEANADEGWAKCYYIGRDGWVSRNGRKRDVKTFKGKIEILLKGTSNVKR
tara:strand:- start:2147 stop:2398 length:252 start_codon:yes stop_codon:yes gene_type:complete